MGFRTEDKLLMQAGVSRYHPLLVVIHWLMVPLILGNIAVGMLIFENMATTDPARPMLLRLHMASGLSIVLLLLVRFVTRLRTRKPPVPQSGALKWLAVGNHWALYLVTFAVTTTGLGTAQLAGIFPILEGKAVVLPNSFDAFPPFAGHVLFSSALLGLLVLHVAAAAWHGTVKRDSILPRMWFGARGND